VVEQFQERLPITYIRDTRKGLSRGRNLGLQHVQGEIIAFPDDDCVYPSTVLEQVHTAFSEDVSLGIFTGMSITPAGISSQGRWGEVAHEIDRYNIWSSQTSYTTFYRASALNVAGLFNEELGVGAGTVWGAGEETELMLRALRKGVRGRYDPTLKIMHPEPLAVFDQTALNRGRLYNRGFGRVMRMENYPFWFVGYMVARPMIGALVALLRGKLGQARYRTIAVTGRARGWCDNTN
jgi:GT2 family glycosyltransferase